MFEKSKNTCPICLEPCVFPVTTNCQHEYCWKCLLEVSNHFDSCPCCRTSCSIDPVAIIIEKLIPNDNYQKYLPNQIIAKNVEKINQDSEFQFDLVSDLHIDQWSKKYQIKNPCGKVIESPIEIMPSPNTTILVVAGDISDDLDTSLEYLNHLSKNYNHVLFVDGNHEHVNLYPELYSREGIHNRISQLCNSKVVYLAKDSFIMHKTVFIGVSGWWDFNGQDIDSIIAAESYFDGWINMNLQQKSQFTRNVLKRAEKEHQELESRIKMYSKDKDITSIILVSHSVPLGGLSTRNLEATETNSKLIGIANSKSYNPKITHWVFGHTHQQHNIQYKGINFISNPRGRPEDFNRVFGYKPIKTIINENVSYKKHILKFSRMHLLYLSILSILNVQVLSFITNRKLELILYENAWIAIDFWFFIHILNTNLIVYAYRNSIRTRWYFVCVVGWELIENIIAPSLSKSLNYFRETPQNLMGDLIAAIPAFLIHLHNK